MSKRFSDRELMQYHDGELPADERDALAAELLEGPEREEAQAKLRALEQLGEGVRTHFELEADRAAPRLANLWARVEKGIEAPDATPARKPVVEAASVGLWGRFNGWLDRYRSNVITSLVTAGAVAALFLAFSPERKGQQGDGPTAGVGPTRSEPRTGSMPMIESLEVMNGSGTILTMPAEAGDSPTAVIWITRETSESRI